MKSICSLVSYSCGNIISLGARPSTTEPLTTPAVLSISWNGNIRNVKRGVILSSRS
jgi:hypothetical protein